MFTWAADRRVRYALFFFLMVSINAIDGMLTGSVADPERRMLVAAAASFDVVVLVSAVYYWMPVRPGIHAPSCLTAIVLAGVLHATYFYPRAGAARLIAAALCEAGLLGYVATQVRRGGRQSGLARLLAAEIGILYYALFSWRAQPTVPPGTRSFSIHKRIGQAEMLGLLAMPCPLEIVPMHLLLRLWSPVAAWIATGLSLYGMLWLIGLARAVVLLPVLVGPDYLDLRYGLLFRLRVPRTMIARVRPAEAGDASFAVPRRSEPNFRIELIGECEGDGRLGIRKRVRRIAITVDEPPAFEKAVAKLWGIE